MLVLNTWVFLHGPGWWLGHHISANRAEGKGRRADKCVSFQESSRWHFPPVQPAGTSPGTPAGCVGWESGGLPTGHGPCHRLGSIPREKGPSGAWGVTSAFPVWCTVPTIYAPKCFIVHNLKSVPTERTLRPPPASGHLCSTLGLCICLMQVCFGSFLPV